MKTRYYHNEFFFGETAYLEHDSHSITKWIISRAGTPEVAKGYPKSVCDELVANGIWHKVELPAKPATQTPDQIGEGKGQDVG